MDDWSYRTAPLPKFPTRWEMFKERCKRRASRAWHWTWPKALICLGLAGCGAGAYKLNQSCPCHAKVQPAVTPVVEQCKK